MKLEFLIVDANVLIDFCKTEKSVLTLVTKHIGKVHVAEPVLAEVLELDRTGATALGLNVLDLEFSKMSRAAVASVVSPLECPRQSVLSTDEFRTRSLRSSCGKFLY